MNASEPSIDSLSQNGEEHRPGNRRSGVAPIVSVIVPTFNRTDAAIACLQALCEQTLAPDRFEIILVDDGSPQPLEPVLRNWINTFSQRNLPIIRVLRQENAGPATARNHGVTEALGEWIAFTDDDCRPLPNWLEALVDAAKQHSDALIAGSTFNGFPQNLYAETNQLILELVYEYFNKDPQDAIFYASNNWLCRRQSFLDLDGFDRSFRRAGGEDRDYCDRWRLSGRRIVFQETARVEHRHGQTLRRYLNMHFRYGSGAKTYLRERLRRQSGTMMDDISFHRNLVRRLPIYLRRYPGMLQKTRILIALALWQFANAAGFAYESIVG
jgi:GT2 family glycosyltransferase